MPACRRLNSRLRQLLLLLSLFSLNPAVHADGIEIDTASIRMINGFYTVEARLIYRLSEKAIEALTHGVPLSFVVSGKINRQRNYLWDLNIYSSRQEYRLEYHALTEQYLVTNQVTGQRRIFLFLTDATEHLGRITMPLGEKAKLQNTKRLTAELYAALDIEALPAPLRPIAYFTPQWHISSPVHELSVP